MGTDQGKLGNMHALGIIADTAGVKMGELGTTTFRPPYTPLNFWNYCWAKCWRVF